MRIGIVVASINELTGLPDLLRSKDRYDTFIAVVDEGDQALRKKNETMLSDIPHAFYGPLERKQWFLTHFGSKGLQYLTVIPERCHAETSFGFLALLETKPDLIIELDDDVAFSGDDILHYHIKNITLDGGRMVISDRKWYNTLENLIMNPSDQAVFPRGHPYAAETRYNEYKWLDIGKSCVLNMGLWSNCPDLDALTILSKGGMDGKCQMKSSGVRREKVIVGNGTYFTICSMNVAFVPKIIPAFYQLYMRPNGVDRFDDIWSGIFLKKIADHLGDCMCLGRPAVNHNKRSRSTFNDLRSELEGMVINEALWRLVDSIEIEGSSYRDGYQSIIDGLTNQIQTFRRKVHIEFMRLQLKKMRLWLDIIDNME